jgi:Mg/Co/Ni transporter MgtE
MSRNRLLVGGLVIVAAIVIAYFAFVYPPVSKEDTSGAIGVANKYRNEQITDKDVMLKDEETAAAAAMAVMSPDEKAAMFERSSFDLQARTLVQCAPEVVAAAMGRADDATLARLFKGLEPQARVEVFERSPIKQAFCKGANVTTERWAKFTLNEKASKLAKASDAEMAVMVKNAAPQERTSFFSKADFALKNDFIKLLDRSDRAKVMERAPAKITEAMERSYSNFEKSARGQE